jgi:hypothetical protein
MNHARSAHAPAPSPNHWTDTSPPPTRTRRGAAALIVPVALGLAAAAMLYLSSLNAPSIIPAAVPAASTSNASLSPDAILRLALRESGLTPLNLAAAGFSAEQVTSLIGSASTQLGTGDAYRQTADAARAARQRVADLERLAQSGRATEDDRYALQSARAALEQADQQHESAKTALLDTALVEVSVDLRDVLSTLRSNAGIEVPPQYRVLARDEATLVRLRDALAESRQAAARGEAPSDATAQWLADTDAHPAVANAKARMDANFQDIETAWNNAAR